MPEIETRETRETRVYPSCCTSMYCCGVGVLDDCKGCRNKPTLDAFNAWVAKHGAIVEDDIWCPTVFTATK